MGPAAETEHPQGRALMWKDSFQYFPSSGLAEGRAGGQLPAGRVPGIPVWLWPARRPPPPWPPSLLGQPRVPVVAAIKGLPGSWDKGVDLPAALLIRASLEQGIFVGWSPLGQECALGVSQATLASAKNLGDAAACRPSRGSSRWRVHLQATLSRSAQGWHGATSALEGPVR